MLKKKFIIHVCSEKWTRLELRFSSSFLGFKLIFILFSSFGRLAILKNVMPKIPYFVYICNFYKFDFDLI